VGGNRSTRKKTHDFRQSVDRLFSHESREKMTENIKEKRYNKNVKKEGNILGLKIKLYVGHQIHGY
jgi:hypothetical protein